jgi:hypothetical protein
MYYCLDSDGVIYGPLHSQSSVDIYNRAIEAAKAQVLQHHDYLGFFTTTVENFAF